MKSAVRFVIAVAICLSGMALVPFAALPNAQIKWERFADAYGDIFFDGFESGDTSAWSQTQPPAGESVFFKIGDGEYYRAWFQGDRALLDADPGGVHEILSGWSSRGVRIFALDAIDEQRRVLEGLAGHRLHRVAPDFGQVHRAPHGANRLRFAWSSTATSIAGVMVSSRSLSEAGVCPSH